MRLVKCLARSIYCTLGGGSEKSVIAESDVAECWGEAGNRPCAQSFTRAYRSWSSGAVLLQQVPVPRVSGSRVSSSRDSALRSSVAA